MLSGTGWGCGVRNWAGMILVGPFLLWMFCGSMEKAQFGQSPVCVQPCCLPGTCGAGLSSSSSFLRTGLLSRAALCSTWAALPPLLCPPAGHKGCEPSLQEEVIPPQGWGELGMAKVAPQRDGRSCPVP